MPKVYQVDYYLKKLLYIHAQCESVSRQQKKEEEAPQDPFTQLRREIALDIRRTRELAKSNWSRYDAAEAAPLSTVQAAKLRADFHTSFRLLKERVTALRRMHQSDLEAFTAPPGSQPETETRLDLQAQAVECAERHLAQLEDYESFGSEETQLDLFGETAAPTVVGSIPEVDDPRFNVLRERDAHIDRGLSDIAEALRAVKRLAGGIAEELSSQEVTTSELDTQVDDVQKAIITLNMTMKDSLTKMRGPKECACTLLIILLILAVGGCAIYLVL